MRKGRKTLHLRYRGPLSESKDRDMVAKAKALGFTRYASGYCFLGSPPGERDLAFEKFTN